MRRFVKRRVAAALERERMALEDYVSEHLSYAEGFPYALFRPAVMIREVRMLKVAALAMSDLPLIHIEAYLTAWLSNRAVHIRGNWDPGVLDAEVQLTAHGSVAPDGTYHIEPRSAALKAWWRDMVR